MSPWIRLDPWKGPVFQGCLNCPPVVRVAPLDMAIAVGFGCAQVTKDRELIYKEPLDCDEEARHLSEFEEMARADPDHDWRVLLVAPVSEREYQRQAGDTWILVRSGPGFA